MNVSIKYKIGIPVAALVIIISALLSMGYISSHKSAANTNLLSTWYKENGEILRINQKIVDIVFPHIRLTMGMDFENNEKTRLLIKARISEIEEMVAQVFKAENLSLDEIQKIEQLQTRVLSLKIKSNEILALRLPHQHQKAMALLDELSYNYITPISSLLIEWYETDQLRVDEIQIEAKTEEAYYNRYASILAILTLAALAFVIWMNNFSIIQPLIKIKEATSHLARGELQHKLVISNEDEIGDLAKDISDMANSLQNINKKLNEAARTDGLTKVLNRRSCDEILDQHINSARRYNQHFTIILLDIDHFKQINDNFGHTSGDIVLQSVARTCHNKIRDCDYIFRYGGEEFLLLLPNTLKKDSLIVTERIRLALESSEIDYEGKQIKVTGSFGIASFPDDGNIIQEIITHADKALYKAKETGRNKAIVYDASTSTDKNMRPEI